MGNHDLAKWWIIVAGVVLMLVGALGFISNPLVGNTDALIPTGTLHNVVHLGTGLLALYIGFGMSGRNLVNGVIGFGILYVVIFVAVLVSPTLFGLFSVPANAYLHVIHAALAVVSLAVDYMARGAVGSQLAAPEPEPPTPPPPQPMQAALSRLSAVWWRFRRLTHSCMS